MSSQQAEWRTSSASRMPHLKKKHGTESMPLSVALNLKTGLPIVSHNAARLANSWQDSSSGHRRLRMNGTLRCLLACATCLIDVDRLNAPVKRVTAYFQS